MAKAYMHLGYYNHDYYVKIWDAVFQGINEFDFDEVKPFIVTLQFML